MKHLFIKQYNAVSPSPSRIKVLLRKIKTVNKERVHEMFTGLIFCFFNMTPSLPF